MFGRQATLALSAVFVMICGTVRASLLVKPYLVIARETGEVIIRMSKVKIESARDSNGDIVSVSEAIWH